MVYRFRGRVLASEWILYDCNMVLLRRHYKYHILIKMNFEHNAEGVRFGRESGEKRVGES